MANHKVSPLKSPEIDPLNDVLKQGAQALLEL